MNSKNVIKLRQRKKRRGIFFNEKWLNFYFFVNVYEKASQWSEKPNQNKKSEFQISQSLLILSKLCVYLLTKFIS
jgi:hypothetical protein